MGSSPDQSTSADSESNASESRPTTTPRQPRPTADNPVSSTSSQDQRSPSQSHEPEPSPEKKALRDILSQFTSPSSPSDEDSVASTDEQSPDNSSDSPNNAPPAKVLLRPDQTSPGAPSKSLRAMTDALQSSRPSSSPSAPPPSHKNQVATRPIDIRRDINMQNTARVPVLSQRPGQLSHLSQAGSSQSDIIRLYRDFVIAMRRSRVDKPISFEAFSEQLKKKQRAIQRKHPRASLKMKVKIKSGKPTISIKPIND